MKEKYWVIDLESIDPHKKTGANDFLLKMKMYNRAPASIDKYRRILEKFFSECPKPLKEMTQDDVLNWLITFYKDKTARTNDLVFSVLSSFFKHCHESEYIEHALIKNGWRQKISKSLPDYLNRRFSPHVCRCTGMLTKGSDIELIKVVTSCNNSDKTRVYASTPSEEIISTYRKIMGLTSDNNSEAIDYFFK